MIEKLIKPVGDILDKFVADKDLKLKLSHELEKEIVSLNRAQIELNKVGAAHENVFVSGWRPFIGWTCGIALCWHFVLAPVTIFICAYLNVVIPELPTFDMGSLMTVLMGMLGLGGLRSFEKYKGLTK